MKSILLLVFFLQLSWFSWAQSRMDSLAQLLKTEKGTEKIDVLNTLASLSLDTSYLRTIEYAGQARELARETGDKYREALALKFIGLGYDADCKYDSAISYFKQSLAIQDSLKTQSEILVLLNLLGTTSKNKSDYKSAAAYLIKAAQIHEENTDSVGMAMSYLNMGNVYLDMEDYENALQYGLKCFGLVSAMHHNYGISMASIQLGITYNKMENYQKAMEYYAIAIKNLKELNDLNSLASAYGGMSDVMIAQNKLSEALYYLDTAYTLIRQTSNKNNLARAFLTYGSIYLEQGMYSKAGSYLTKAIHVSEENNRPVEQMEGYFMLSKVDSARDDYKKAFRHYTLFQHLKDSLESVQTKQEIAEIKTRYETEKKEKENIALAADNQIQKLLLSQKNLIIYSLVGGFFIIAILLVLIYRQYLNKNRAYQSLVRKNIELAKKDLVEQGLGTNDQTANSNPESECKEDGIESNIYSELILHLKEYFRDEKPYLHSKLSMDDLCKSLNTNRSYLSRAINECMKKSFYELINEYRIREARLLLMDKKYDHISIEGIGQMVGFASRSTFYAYFNKELGISPSFFRQSLKH